MLASEQDQTAPGRRCKMPIMSNIVVRRILLPLVALIAGLPAAARAQGEAPPPPPAAAPAPAPPGQPDPDQQSQPAEPDFTLAALPATLRMPLRKFVFRMTHRFTRAIDAGDAGDFFADLFGLDSSARVGLELRYGLLPGTQVGVHRTNDREIQFFGQQDLWRGGNGIALQALAAVSGADNFSEEFAGTVGALVSKRFGTRGAVYVEPISVFNANPFDDTTPVEAAGVPRDDHAFMLGLGARVRVGTTVYVFGEAAPRLAGYDAGAHHVSVGIEKRAGGHVFQFNVSNALGTTFRQIALGGPDTDDWFIGFNLTRRFF
jgi:Membrane bound beta barrel domain (DUF5777)